VNPSELTDLALSDFPADPQALHLQVNLFFKKMWQSSLPWPLAYCLLAHFVYVWFLLSISQINTSESTHLTLSDFPADPQTLHLQVNLFLTNCARLIRVVDSFTNNTSDTSSPRPARARPGGPQ